MKVINVHLRLIGEIIHDSVVKYIIRVQVISCCTFKNICDLKNASKALSSLNYF